MSLDSVVSHHKRGRAITQQLALHLGGGQIRSILNYLDRHQTARLLVLCQEYLPKASTHQQSISVSTPRQAVASIHNDSEEPLP